ncbi:TetR/AcrR family transcriptional regulator [Paenibacillus glycanilyticus]|uniref:TetR/AcrR family transcriptional regulator n=1 Tax=Paenibacillus glycanilyticus TaxID=126569 RepID=UPI00204236AC|nr:TetR/AcrR family transcriptional regulator [Paenibacillus glycanilyticus]MCM3628317.1 TetR/AcrR family transcriptional regulator [Paenibacillus glycanilyticus]
MDTLVKTDRRILRTKQSIKKSFLELFSEKHFEQITINEIADRANVNRGTIYLHYTDKYDLLDKCIEDHINELISLCEKRESATISSEPVFHYFRDHYPFFSAMFSNERVLLFRDRMINFFSVNMMAKMESTDENIDKELKAQFLASAFIGVVEWWIRRQMPHSIQFMADQVRNLFEKNHV